jgi:organic hydroperoxide reductase OsmC/OhrA
MTEHTASVRWDRGNLPFTHDRYSRVHEWSFDGGATVRASASPHVVPVPLSDPAPVDPEEAFVAALSSCHMLWFLALAAKRGVVVDAYEDEAVGTMLPLGDGRQVLGRIVLRPRIRLGSPTSAEQLDRLHREAHHQCFLANALSAELKVEPRPIELSSG